MANFEIRFSRKEILKFTCLFNEVSIEMVVHSPLTWNILRITRAVQKFCPKACQNISIAQTCRSRLRKYYILRLSLRIQTFFTFIENSVLSICFHIFTMFVASLGLELHNAITNALGDTIRPALQCIRMA